MVTYTNKKGQRVTVPLVHRYALIAVDVFSRYTWVRLLQTPKGAGVNAAWDCGEKCRRLLSEVWLFSNPACA